MSTITASNKLPKDRIKFIDMARSVAILLMLEGHFVDDSLMESFRDPDNIIYFSWHFVRGFTAPVFLTVTGLIFVYLMLKNSHESFFTNIRIRKGFKRVIELIFWGAVVQFYAFHVLECIAFAVLSILIIFGLYKLIRVIPLWILFLIAAMSVFSLYPFIKNHYGSGTFIEKSLLSGIKSIYNSGRENTIHFPIFPFMGYTFFGAMIGALLHSFPNKVKTMAFPTIFLSIGALMFYAGKIILGGLDSFIDLFSASWNYEFVKIDFLLERAGIVFMILSFLMYVDNLWGSKLKSSSLFLKIGQNTLTIYILHMVLLYGSITSLGLNKLFHKSLGPWQVLVGALLFIGVFVVLIKYLDWIKEKLSFILHPIKRFFNTLFFIQL